MTCQEADGLCGSLRLGITILGHYGMFQSNTVDPELFEKYVNVKYPHLSICLCESGAGYFFNVLTNDIT
ncbi:MAG: hypothetical protein OCC45_03485 [Desulfotalea sp.]